MRCSGVEKVRRISRPEQVLSHLTGPTPQGRWRAVAMSEHSTHAARAEQPQVEYRPVSCFPGYRVGSDGSVWSCWAKRSLGIGRGAAYFIGKEWKPMKCRPNIKSGYLQVMLSAGKRKCLRHVHRLVLEAFVGPCPDGMEVCHDPDRDKTNCRLDNLRWDTRANNHADKIKHGTTCRGDRHYSRTRPESVPRGERHHAAKITEAIVREIRSLATRGVPRPVIQRKFGLSEAGVRRVIIRETWAHVP
jgi:hypothetical protein